MEKFDLCYFGFLGCVPLLFPFVQAGLVFENPLASLPDITGTVAFQLGEQASE